MAHPQARGTPALPRDLLQFFDNELCSPIVNTLCRGDDVLYIDMIHIVNPTTTSARASPRIIQSPWHNSDEGRKSPKRAAIHGGMTDRVPTVSDSSPFLIRDLCSKTNDAPLFFPERHKPQNPASHVHTCQRRKRHHREHDYPGSPVQGYHSEHTAGRGVQGDVAASISLPRSSRARAGSTTWRGHRVAGLPGCG